MKGKMGMRLSIIRERRKDRERGMDGEYEKWRSHGFILGGKQ